MSDAPADPTQPRDATRGAALDLAMAALDGLAELGETITDEWTYVTALAETGRARLRAAGGADLTAPLSADRAGAVAAACAEVARIADPHRAVDWLSTFPAVVELALGATDGGAVAGRGADMAAGPTPPVTSGR
jgi:hypothetical protein